MDEVRKILLASSVSKSSVNEDTKLDIDISNDEKKFPANSVDTTIDQYRRYVTENDASNKYRFVFTINPICSNVLYNHVSEIVSGEGSENCIFYGKSDKELSNSYNKYKYGTIKQSLNRTDLIADTAYSHKDLGNLTYHCGLDIFNNHTLRRKEFVIISPLSNSTDENYKKYKENFNTISDYVREIDGSVLKTNEGDKSIDSHLYFRDTIKTFEESIEDNLIEKDGWFGFDNPTGIDIQNVNIGNTNIAINKCMNNNKPCEFIDLYPDRSLFSFLPKINSYRHREEYNWDYCITYPYKNYTDNELVSLKDSEGNEIANGMLTMFSDEYGERINGEVGIDSLIKKNNDSEYSDVFLYTKISNSLKIGDYVKLLLVGDNNNTTYTKEILPSIKISGIGLNGYNLMYYFSINLGDIISELKNLKKLCNDNVTNLRCYTRRIVDGRPCKYYFRKFKRLPNFKNSNVDKDYITESDIDNNCLKNFNSSLNKLAFGLNIYGDRMSQIVFDDDINIYGLRDNLGRDLHEVFLTIIKANRGYDKWYNDTLTDYKRFCDESIEYSHCFGKITSGIDMPWVANSDENGYDDDDYNIHKLHNIFQNANNESETFNDITANLFPKSVEPLEENITCSGSTTFSDEPGVFLGDIVELSENDVEETVLETVCHRFNTAQRETLLDEFSTITKTEIVSDDYDADEFTTEDTSYTSPYRANLAPEGYYYKAHYRIPLREFATTINEGQHTKVTLTNASSKVETYFTKVTCTTDKNYYFQACDKILIYNKNTNKKYIGEIINVSGSDFTNLEFSVTGLTLSDETISNFNFYKPNSEKPYYAYDFDDGSGIYRWRLIESCENLKTDSEVYDMVFTNGAHYFHNNINFFLRRQDPYCLYELNTYYNEKLPLMEQYGHDKDITKVENLGEEGVTIC